MYTALRFTFSLLMLLLTIPKKIPAEVIFGDNDRFCYPEAHKNTRKPCECSNVNSSPWGMRAIVIDCSYKDFKGESISTLLPLYVETFDLSWNSLEFVPRFHSDTLRILNLMHNNVTKVVEKNFISVSNLRELYLSWNSIQTIEEHAFEGLSHLLVVDLSHNNLQALSLNTFAPLLTLNSLSLSWNRQLKSTFIAKNYTFYDAYGIQDNLHTLKLKACSLSTLMLPKQVTLRYLDLRRNNFFQVPPDMPQTLEILDISENLLEALQLKDTENYPKLQQLFVEDMPRLKLIAENAFTPMHALKKLSFQNSRHLTYIHPKAFGEQKFPSLEKIIFRGTALRSFNSTLLPIFRNLTILDLKGVPLYCDCEMIWVQQLSLETNGRCYKPSHLTGMLLSNVRSSDLSCNHWSSWVYGFITLGLIALFSVVLYFIVMGLRPHRHVTMRRKIGESSPYARVTIEPTRQDY